MSDWRVEGLNPGHERQGFDCGKPELNGFLHTLVSQYEKRGLGRTYVACLAGERRVVGNYTIASGAVQPERLPANQAKRLPRHSVPVVLLGRLAVDRSTQRSGLGAYLLRDSMARSLGLSDSLGIHALVVDALDQEAKSFYERFGFVALLDDPMRLFLPLATVRSATNR